MAVPGRSTGSPKSVVDWEEASRLAHEVALRFLRHRQRQLAEDVAQDALFKLRNHFETIRGKWQPWLKIVVTNLARNALRTEARARARVHANSTILDGALQLYPNPPDQQLEQSEEKELLDSLLGQLDAEFGKGTRAIVEFRAFEMEWREIAIATGLCSRTCSYRYNHAFAWLQRRMSPQLTRGDHCE
jgi:RNA polymerase sigma factor (sigma-70 family)